MNKPARENQDRPRPIPYTEQLSAAVGVLAPDAMAQLRASVACTSKDPSEGPPSCERDYPSFSTYLSDIRDSGYPKV